MTISATFGSCGVADQCGCLSIHLNRVLSYLSSVGLCDQSSCLQVMTTNILNSFTEPIIAIMEQDESFVVIQTQGG